MKPPIISFNKMCAITFFFTIYYYIIYLTLYFLYSSEDNVQTVGRVVFGEARGEPREGQIAVAYSIVNRIKHEGYPNSLTAVVNQTTETGGYQYHTLDLESHTQAWNEAKVEQTLEYNNTIEASRDVLCVGVKDPTTCATDFCALDPCPATASNPWWTTINKIKLGNHYFVCRVPA